MSVTTKTVWGAGFTAEMDTQWATLKSDFLSEAVSSGKTDGQAEEVDGVTYGGKRTWADQETANGWKALVESAAATLGVSATVTFE